MKGMRPPIPSPEPAPTSGVQAEAEWPEGVPDLVQREQGGDVDDAVLLAMGAASGSSVAGGSGVGGASGAGPEVVEVLQGGEEQVLSTQAGEGATSARLAEQFEAHDAWVHPNPKTLPLNPRTLT